MIKYVSNNGEEFALDGYPFYALGDTDITNHSWTLPDFVRSIEQKNLKVAIYGNNREDVAGNVNSLMEATEKDVEMQVPGRIYVDDYFLEAYISSAARVPEYINNRHAVLEFGVNATDGAWRKEQLFRFRYQNAGQEAENGKAYPYGYPYDYGLDGSFVGLIDNDHYLPSDFVMIIYGYVKRPRITIAGMTYTLKMTIDSGERVIITSKDREIILIKERDVRSNAFRYRDPRFDIFSKIQPGENRVNWNAQFDFDVWLLPERSEPLWK